MAYKRISPQPVIEGGTGATTLTAHGVLLGEGTSAIVPTAVGTTGQVLTGVTASDPVWAAPAASSISITGNSGGALTGNAFTFTGGTTGLTFSGAGSTETLGGTLVVSNGGTGAGTFTAHGVLLGEGTSAFGVTAVGTTGQVFTGVTGSDPVWASPAASSISITGDTGGALTGAAFTFAGGTTGLSFGGSGSTETLTFSGITANGGTVSLATDATTSTINVGTGAGAKTVTLGSTNSTSSLALKTGTADFSLASATGTIINALDTGEITYPLQPLFLAYLATNDNNRTGNGTGYTIGTNTAFTEIIDRNSDFNTNGTFTAPVTGAYALFSNIGITGCTIASSFQITLILSNRTWSLVTNRAASNADFYNQISSVCDMDAGDTAVTQVAVSGEAGLTDDIFGNSVLVTNFSGYLIG